MNGSPAKNRFRPAQSSDVLFMLNLIRDGYKKHCSIYGIKFDGASAMFTIANVMARGVCLVGSSSCAGAVIAPFQYNHKAIIAQVMFWNFKAPREIEIFDALSDACKEAGATHINAASHFPNNTISRYYAKKMLINCEVQSMKQL